MKEPGELAECIGIEGLEACAGRADSVEINLDVGDVEPNALAIGDYSPSPRVVDGAPKLAQAPAEAPAWVVSYVPEQFAQLLPPMFAPGGRQIAEECARLLRWRKVYRIAVSLETQGAQEVQCQPGHWENIPGRSETMKGKVTGSRRR